MDLFEELEQGVSSFQEYVANVDWGKVLYAPVSVVPQGPVDPMIDPYVPPGVPKKTEDVLKWGPLEEAIRADVVGSGAGVPTPEMYDALLIAIATTPDELWMPGEEDESLAGGELEKALGIQMAGIPLAGAALSLLGMLLKYILSRWGVAGIVSTLASLGISALIKGVLSGGDVRAIYEGNRLIGTTDGNVAMAVSRTRRSNLTLRRLKADGTRRVIAR